MTISQSDRSSSTKKENYECLPNLCCLALHELDCVTEGHWDSLGNLGKTPGNPLLTVPAQHMQSWQPSHAAHAGKTKENLRHSARCQHLVYCNRYNGKKERKDGKIEVKGESKKQKENEQIPKEYKDQQAQQEH